MNELKKWLRRGLRWLLRQIGDDQAPAAEPKARSAEDGYEPGGGSSGGGGESGGW